MFFFCFLFSLSISLALLSSSTAISSLSHYFLCTYTLSSKFYLTLSTWAYISKCMTQILHYSTRDNMVVSWSMHQWLTSPNRFCPTSVRLSFPYWSTNSTTQTRSLAGSGTSFPRHNAPIEAPGDLFGGSHTWGKKNKATQRRRRRRHRRRRRRRRNQQR